VHRVIESESHPLFGLVMRPWTVPERQCHFHAFDALEHLDEVVANVEETHKGDLHGACSHETIRQSPSVGELHRSKTPRRPLARTVMTSLASMIV